MATKCRKFENFFKPQQDAIEGRTQKPQKSHKKRFYNTYFFLKKFLQQNLKETAFTTVFYGIQPPSQSSKDVGRFHVAASQPQVAITGWQGTLNNPRTFRKEKGTQLTLLWSCLDSEIGGTCNTSFQCLLPYNVAHWRYLRLKNPNFFLF